MPVGGGSARSPPRCRRCSSGSSNTSSWNSNLTSRPTNCCAHATARTSLSERSSRSSPLPTARRAPGMAGWPPRSPSRPPPSARIPLPTRQGSPSSKRSSPQPWSLSPQTTGSPSGCTSWTRCPRTRWPAPSPPQTPRQSTTPCIAPSRPSVPASSRRGSRGETCEPRASSPGPTVRITSPMRRAMLRSGRVTHPAPESLIPYALGAADPATGRHVEDCPTCRAEIGREPVARWVVATRARRGSGAAAAAARPAPQRRWLDARAPRHDADQRRRARADRPARVGSPGGPARLVQGAAGRAIPLEAVRQRGGRPVDGRNGGYRGGAARLRRALVSRHVLLEGRGTDRVEAVGRLGLGGVPARRAVTMSAFTAACSVLVLVAQSPQDVAEMRALARDGPDSVLVGRVRQRNDAARKAWSQLRTAAGGGDSADVALIAAERLAGAYAVAWQDSFFVRQITRFRSLSPAARQATLAADSIRLAGNAALRTGADAALQAWRESLRRYEALADTAGLASVLTAMGAGFHSAQQSDSAEAYLALAQGYAERIGDARMLGNALSILGILSWQRGDLQRARDFYTRAKPFRERSGDVVGFAVDQTNLGAVTFSLGDFAGARRAWEAALPAARSLGGAEGAALILSKLAGLAQREGDYTDAAARANEALSIYRERGNRVYEAQVLVNLGRLAMMRGDFPAAVTTLSEAAGIMRRIGSGPSINAIDNYVALSQARAHMGDVQGARTELQRAEALAARRDRPNSGASLAALARARADLAFEVNELAEAERQYGRAQRLAQGSGIQEKEEQFLAELGMARVLLKRESYQRAQVVLKRLLLRPSTDPQDRAEIRLGIGLAAWRGGGTATARRGFGDAVDTLRSLGAGKGEGEGAAAP